MSNDELKNKPESYWKDKLTPEQFRILREAGTESPFSGDLLENKQEGMYTCAACGQDLFKSDTKFESGTGWPSFYEALDADKVELIDDTSYGMHRVEVKCSKCGSHLGHVFDDGPQPTGERYCINSVCLDFKPKQDKSEKED